MGTSFENLKDRILSNSKSNTWDQAVHEWYVSAWKEDLTVSSQCICGHENIRYLYEITNELNYKKLFPIGSTCIKKFEREDLTNLVDTLEQFYVLMHAVESKRFINLDSTYFSRKLINYFFEEGVIEDDEYDFLIKMFNKKNKFEISEQQTKYIRYLVGVKILNFIRGKLAEKQMN